jgi:nitrogen regulatory protein PII
MKEIRAYIKPHKLPDVTAVLRNVDGLTGMSVIDCRGFGVGRGVGAEDPEGGDFDFRNVVKIEVICLESHVDEVTAAIESAAHTGLKGDGKIYVGEISHAVRISTGETGEDAV